jgi:glycosyltransferase involved in cell wall biosynthesis
LPPAPQALFVSYTALRGGAESLLLDCATAVEGPVAVACPEGPLADAARDTGLIVVPLRARRLERRASVRDRVGTPLRIAAQAREVRRAIRDLRPQVVVGWGMRGLLSSAAALRGVRPRPPLLFQHNDFLPESRAGAAAVRSAVGRAERVVCLSRAVAEELDPEDRLSGRVEVIYPGVDLVRLSPGPPRAGAPEALTLGAIVAWKRPDLALEAAARTPGLRLRLAGAPLDDEGGRLLAELRERAGRPDLAGRVELVGRLEDPVEALRGATCLLHCADREPFGLVLVEALACGIPVVAPAAGGPAEIVDESCGVLFEPGDPDAAAAALRWLLDDHERAARMRAGARSRAERHFGREGTRGRYRELVRELVAR